MSQENIQNIIAAECARRRTFAIISHPDAGKTTLTEKLLLYSGMIRTAGMVRARKGRKSVQSDWMGMEQERGISITASAMQFEYHNAIVNVLDTPGHQDFSEDTYRTLTAADSAIMVIDASKGVEAQTRKLFAVCRLRNIPVLTFINKMDLPGKDPFELMSEVEEVLGIHATPLNWPLGSGKEFVGLARCDTRGLLLFSRETGEGGQKLVHATASTFEAARSSGAVNEKLLAQTAEELDIVQHAGNTFSRESFLAGKITPVFFGSALTNIGVEPFFNSFVDLAPSPRSRRANVQGSEDLQIDPAGKAFSAYVFKIQANMDPKHRDSMAYLRICSGRFERELPVTHHRSGKQIRLSRSHSMFGGERNTIEFAYPGDIIGVINPGVFQIGDTVSLEGGFNFPPMPKFAPERIARIRTPDVSKRKAFDKGLTQLATEGTVQILHPLDTANREPLIAAVGALQFEVLQYRLEHEYRVKTLLEPLQYEYGAWLKGDPSTFKKLSSSLLAKDESGNCAVLFRTPWELEHTRSQNPEHQLLEFTEV